MNGTLERFYFVRHLLTLISELATWDCERKLSKSHKSKRTIYVVWREKINHICASAW